MRLFLLVMLGAIVSAVLGVIAGALIGSAFVSLSGMSCREGACGMAVFFGFAPAGLVLGAIIGAILVFRRVQRPSSDQEPTEG